MSADNGQAKRRQDAVVDAARGKAFPMLVNTKYGAVRIQRLEPGGEGDTLWVDVYVSSVGGDPHHRIINPPIGVRQKDGSVVVDPLRAVAEVIALGGGAVHIGRKRRGVRR